jgi:hypothetical protein
MTKTAHKLVYDDNDLANPKERCVKNVGSNSDQGYFNTYSHFAIHHEMLTVIGVDLNLYKIISYLNNVFNYFSLITG